VRVLSVAPGQPRSTHVVDAVTVLRAPLPRLRGAGRLTRMPQAWRRVELARAVAREVRRLDPRPDVVEVPEWGAEGLALAVRGELPVVVRLHSSAAQLFPFSGQGRGLRGLDGRAAIALEATAARRADLVISTAANAAQGAQLLGLDPARVHAIPHPVVPRSPAPAAGGPPRILFAGRLEERKGAEVLVRALPAVLATAPEARLLLAGRDAGAEHCLLELAAVLGVAGAVELLGHRTPEQLAADMAAATVVAIPSRWESFGNVVAEAASAGRPVVASDIPPFRELVLAGETGRLLPPRDPEAWGRALCELLREPERAACMGAAGARHVQALGDPARVAALTLDAYAEAIAAAESGAGPPAWRRRT
jgi:glycosyltransferase involved in cell wall biosynthesis